MNKPSLILLTLGALALAGGLFVWMQDGAMTPPPAPPGVGAGEPAAPDAQEIRVEVAEAEAADAGFEQGVFEEPERIELEPVVDAAPRLVLQVWDRKRGAAAAEAEVFVLQGYDGPELEGVFRIHRAEATIARGKRYQATSDGQVTLPRLEERTMIAARLPGAVGFRLLDEGHREQEEVFLRSDETVTVRVVDGEGRPVAGAPVGVQQRVCERVDVRGMRRENARARERVASLQAELREQPLAAQELRDRLGWYRRRWAETQRRLDRAEKAEAEQKARVAAAKQAGRPVSKEAAGALVETRYEVRARRRTDDDGYAVFRHFQFARERQEKWWPKEHRDRFDAVLMTPLAEPVRKPFLGRPVPEEPLVLEMPPTGAVVLRTVDCDGRPFTHPVRGSLRIQDGRNPGWTRLPLRKEQDERAIVFEHVGLGLQLAADCRLDDADFRWRAPAFVGPERPGERKVVDLVVAPDAAMLYGRVLDAAGRPLGGREMTFLINSARGRLEGEEVVLDDEGRFHLPYEARRGHAAPFRFQVRHEEDEEVPGLARTLPALPSEGVTDVGDLQVDLLGLVAFGRVVDDRGEPIEDAHVQLQRERPTGRDGARMRFQDEAFTDAHSDEDGLFRLVGDREAARYRLRVRADGHFPEETENVNAATGAEVRLMRKARLVGTVTLPEWMPSRRVKVELRSLDDPGRNKDGQVVDYRGKQYIYFDWVRPGLYNVALRIQEFPGPFLRVDGLQVRPGDHDPHPRLLGLDLSSMLYRFEVSAVDEVGKRVNPKSPLLARVSRPDGSSQFVGFSWKGGRVEVVNSQPVLEVRPVAPGFRADDAVLSPGRSELRFLRVPPLRLHAPGVRGVVGDAGVWIGMRLLDPPVLERLDGRGGRSTRGFARATSSYGRLGADERARIAPLMDGRYRVAAYIGDKSKGDLAEVALGEVDVRVVPGGPPVVLQVQADPAALQAAMQQVQAGAGAELGR